MSDEAVCAGLVTLLGKILAPAWVLDCMCSI